MESSQLRRICSEIKSKVHQKFTRLLAKWSHSLLEGQTSVFGLAPSCEIPHPRYSWTFRALLLLQSHPKAAQEIQEVPKSCSSWSSPSWLCFDSPSTEDPGQAGKVWTLLLWALISVRLSWGWGSLIPEISASLLTLLTYTTPKGPH